MMSMMMNSWGGWGGNDKGGGSKGSPQGVVSLGRLTHMLVNSGIRSRMASQSTNCQFLLQLASGIKPADTT